MVAQPDVLVHQTSFNDDFILLGSDGIFDCYSNQDICGTVFAVLEFYEKNGGMQTPDGEEAAIEQILDEVVTTVMKQSLINKSEDNITVICLFFKGFLDMVRNAIKPKN